MRIGTGNIAGVAVALYAGGPGAMFWMIKMCIRDRLQTFPVYENSRVVLYWENQSTEAEKNAEKDRENRKGRKESMFQKNRFQILIEAGWLKGIFKSGRGLMVLIASMLLMSCGGAATERSMAGSDESAAEETAMNTTTAAETPISSEAAAESADGIAFSLGSRSISTCLLYTSRLLCCGRA